MKTETPDTKSTADKVVNGLKELRSMCLWWAFAFAGYMIFLEIFYPIKAKESADGYWIVVAFILLDGFFGAFIRGYMKEK